MKTFIASIGVLAVSIWFILPRAHHATTTLDDGVEITISITPMPGLHSDWHRRVAIRHNGQHIRQKLFADTGWWRGSNLYRHASGTYVIHEGQGWCFSFKTDPLVFAATPDVFCVKGQVPPNSDRRRSLYYQDMTYLGHFYETSRDQDGVRIRFSDASQTPEVELSEGP